MEIPISRPASERIVVPVRHLSDGIDVLMTGAMPDGTKTAIAFTSLARLEAAMGCGVPYDHLTLNRLHQMLDPIGIERVQVDPDLVMSPLVTQSSSLG